MSDQLIAAGGLVVKFDNPELFVEGMRILRQIELDRNVIVLMEDLDSFIDDWSESSILNILDGIDQIENVVFLATTNYPEKILGRIKDRPSRFDRVFEFGPPDKNIRSYYLDNLVDKYKKTNKTLELDKDKWIADTDKLSIAHMKELFISVNIFGYDYEETLKLLKGMKKKIKNAEEAVQETVGF